MRAKTINEIRQGVEGSGLGAIGIGKISMIRGYDYISNKWPYLDKVMIKDNIIDEIVTNTNVDKAYVTSSINKIAKICNCGMEDIAVIHMKTIALHSMMSWISFELSNNENTIIERVVLEDMWYKIIASNVWNVGTVSYTVENPNNNGSTFSKYYFMRYK